MAPTDPPRPDPFGDVRAAFERLGTSEKAAFTFEATFATIGQALAETGRRVAGAIDDLDVDAWFRPPPRPPRQRKPPRPATPPPPPAGPVPPDGPLGTPPVGDLPTPPDVPPPDAT